MPPATRSRPREMPRRDFGMYRHRRVRVYCVVIIVPSSACVIIHGRRVGLRLMMWSLSDDYHVRQLRLIRSPISLSIRISLYLFRCQWHRQCASSDAPLIVHPPHHTHGQTYWQQRHATVTSYSSTHARAPSTTHGHPYVASQAHTSSRRCSRRGNACPLCLPW